MWLSPKWFCFLFIYFVLYHGPEASKVQIKLTYLLVVIDFLCFMKLQVVFSTANFVYKFKKSENFEKRRDNANGNANI